MHTVKPVRFRQFLRIASACVFVLAGIGIDTAAAQSTTRPNIVFVLVDDMSWSSTSVLMDPNVPESKSDYHQTPRLEELASLGVTFSNGYSAGPICSPSRAALMTGRSPAAMRVTDLRHANNVTDSFFTKNYVNRPLRAPQPLRVLNHELNYVELIEHQSAQYQHGFFGKYDWWPQANLEGFNSFNTGVSSSSDDPLGVYGKTNAAINFMRSNSSSSTPFMVTISHDAVKSSAASQAALDFVDTLEPGERHYNRTYAATHYDLDQSVGMLLDEVRDLGIEDNTYFVFTADHGGAFDVAGRDRINEPLSGGKGNLLEGGIRVPYIIAGPGIAAGTYSQTPVTAVDIVPTILDLIGTQPPSTAQLEGTSLVPILQSGDSSQPLSRRFAENGELFFHYPHYGNPVVTGPITPASAVRDGRYKLLRIYGQNGSPDTNLLFDLEASLQESPDPSSPLNLASQLPDVFTSLTQKLDRWIQDADADLPIDIRTPFSLNWRGDQLGQVAGQWRSVDDIDYRDHEIWTMNRSPTTTSASPYQPGLSKTAVSFNNTANLLSTHLTVSNTNATTPDSNHSVSVELWLRLDDLSGQRMLFEAGRDFQGFSLSMGDADSDGFGDDLRFRLVSLSGESATLTVDASQHGNLDRDFVLVTAVVDDTPGQRHIELFLNGTSTGTAEFSNTSALLDWDHINLTEIGARSPVSSNAGIGGNSGAGDLPFVSGGLRGQLAGFSIHNFRLDASEILNRYNSVLDRPDFGIVATQGDTTIVVNRPANVAISEFESVGSLVVIEERRDILDTSLAVDHVAAANTSIGSGGLATASGSLTAGTEFTSYLLHFDPDASAMGLVNVTGSISFAGNILGLIIGDTTLAATDTLLGSIGNYGDSPRSISLDTTDSLTISDDQKTLTFNLFVDAAAMIDLRVITETAVPGDFNGDGHVDAADYTVWRDNLGTTGVATSAMGDANNDGNVTAEDYAIWRSYFGQTAIDFAGASLANATVPEPHSACIVLSMLVGFVASNCRRLRKSTR